MITNTNTNNISTPANSKKLAFLLVLLTEVGFIGLTHKQKLSIVQTCLDCTIRAFTYILENSYDNSLSAQRKRGKKSKYTPQSGTSSAFSIGDSEYSSFKGIAGSDSYKRKKVIPEKRTNQKSKNWRAHPCCNCLQQSSAHPLHHNMNF